MDTGRALLVGALVSLIGFLALTSVVTQNRFNSADRLARALVRQPRHPLLTSSMEAASFLGGQPGQVAAVALGSAMLWRRRRRLWALSLPIVMAGAGTLQFAVKWAVDRPRPNLQPLGFPSAHTLSLVVLLGFIAYVVGTSRARRAWRGLGAGVCGAVLCAIIYSRMYLDAHWLSDVLGGLSLGLAYLLLAVWLIRSALALREKPLPQAAPVRSGAGGLPAVAATGAPAAGPLAGAAAGS